MDPSALLEHPTLSADEVVSPTIHGFNVATFNPSVDRLISACLSLAGEWEQQGSFLLRQVLRVFADPADTLFVDAGANIGYFSLLAASVGFETVAVEMSVENALKLARSAALFNEGKREREEPSPADLICSMRWIVEGPHVRDPQGTEFVPCTVHGRSRAGGLIRHLS